MMAIPFELHVSPAPCRHGSWKADGIHPLKNRLFDFLLGGTIMSRTTNVASHGRFEAGADRDSDFDQSAGFGIEWSRGVDRLSHPFVRLNELWKAIHEQLERVRHFLVLPMPI